MKTRLLIQDSTGFSIVSALVGTSIALIGALALSKMLIDQSKTISYLEDRLSTNSLASEVQMVLAPELACIQSLSGARLSVATDGGNSPPVTIRDRTSTERFKAPQKYDRLEISRIVLNIPTPIPAGGSGEVDFVVSLQRQRGEGFGQLAPITIKKLVHLDPASNVTSCTSLGATGPIEDPSKPPCLKPSLSEAVNASKSWSVPDTTKSITLDLGGSSGSRSSGSGNNKETHTWNIPGQRVTLHLGQTKIGGKTLEAGKELRYEQTSSSVPGKWIYDNVDVGSFRRVIVSGGNVKYEPEAPSHLTNANLGSTCPDENSVAAPRSDSFGSSGSNGSAVTFWK